MLCVVQSGGALVLVDPPPVNPDATTCPYVVASFQESSADVMRITPEQGGQLGAAVLLVWAVAFVFRLSIKALSTGETNEPERS